MRSGNDPTCLVGEALSAVSFVRDYVEFHFDGPILRSLNDPIVRHAATQVTCSDSGWRDALCSIIGGVIERVDMVSGDRIELRTTDGKQLVVPLDEAARVGPEAAHFVPAEEDGRLRVKDMLIW